MKKPIGEYVLTSEELPVKPGRYYVIFKSAHVGNAEWNEHMKEFWLKYIESWVKLY